MNRLRDRGVTALFLLEIDAFGGQALTVPVQNISATMDNGLLMRTVEFKSSLRRMISVLKERQIEFDPTIRELLIGSQGIVVGDPFDASSVLSGTATPLYDAS